jgi:hypothetical protein
MYEFFLLCNLSSNDQQLFETIAKYKKKLQTNWSEVRIQKTPRVSFTGFGYLATQCHLSFKQQAVNYSRCIDVSVECVRQELIVVDLTVHLLIKL